MPLDPSDLPDEVQVAFFIFDFLEDNWEGMSGTYLGKHWGNIEYLFNLFKVEDEATVLKLMKRWEAVLISYRSEKQKEREAAEKRKSAGGGKNYTHNVKR